MSLCLVKPFIHPSFHEVLKHMSFGDRLSFLAVHTIDKLNLWHRLPVLLGLLYLQARRTLHEKYNLIMVGERDNTPFNPDQYPYRTSNGEYNNPESVKEGSQLTFFGRNMPPMDQKDELMSPDPVMVAAKFLARRTFKDTGKQFNVIAASWIQFMIHDWIDHLEDTQQVELVAPPEIASECPLKSFKFFKTKEVPTNAQGIKSGHLNIRTPWWDASAIYGSDSNKSSKVRSFVDGKLKIGDNNLLRHMHNGIALSGDIRNSWAGVSVLQALFVKEHNAVCDALKSEYPKLTDDELYHYARLVTSAVIAKIHTIDWTVELLKTDTMNAGMHANWYGLLGKRFKSIFGHVGGTALGGLVGLDKPNNHGVPYSLTEDFTSVYRMHSLLPDTLTLRNINANPGPNKSPAILEDIKMEELIGIKGEESLASIGFERQLVSMGHQASGALELWNYPLFFRDLVAQNVDGTPRPDHVDLAALEVYRDRERNVPRYNQFRRGMLMIPISKWEDLTDDKEAIETLREVYGDDVEKLDLIVGLMAEKKIKGFAISETAFFIFIIMASRRLEADRFFTSYFNEKTYTKKGFAWVNNTESLRDVITRHFPEITTKWLNSTSAFSVWDSPPNSFNFIPLLLRIP
ncbi:alpha-dioxygenase 1 [Dioscorea cayenensis subsp. rotundata]|uniref:Alpha-dioxygenase 1 n=1 Tax=Dioscorea cayennensis subsp. rotundata TaxID=55577 RepID=A0AB40CJE1_DIOCR|nr:alpha-dioxygenase 1 [Dioscorea cayenensis subsp. rotundata]